MKWFFSYAQVYRDGRFQFGHNCSTRHEHPVNTVSRWNEDYGQKDGFQCVLISFQQVPDDTPDADVLSHGIS